MVCKVRHFGNMSENIRTSFVWHHLRRGDRAGDRAGDREQRRDLAGIIFGGGDHLRRGDRAGDRAGDRGKNQSVPVGFILNKAGLPRMCHPPGTTPAQTP